MKTLFICDCWNNCETFSLVLTVFVALLPYIVLHFLKPKLFIDNSSIETDENGKEFIKIKVLNKRKCSAANNVRIEICALDTSNNTYHFIPDFENFLIIPKNDFRIFKSYSILESTKLTYNITYDQLINGLRNGEYTLRVRIHSYHSFSGFGKANEKTFDRF